MSITSTWSDTFGTSHEVHYEYELGRKDVALGLGGAWPLGSRLDFTGEVLFIDSELTETLAGGSWTLINPDLPDPRRTVALCELDACESLTLDDEGFAARIGLRGEVTERFELYGSLTYYISDLDPSYTYVQLGKTMNIDLDETAFAAGARFAVMEKFFLSLGYVKQGDFASLHAGARIGF